MQEWCSCPHGHMAKSTSPIQAHTFCPLWEAHPPHTQPQNNKNAHVNVRKHHFVYNLHWWCFKLAFTGVCGGPFWLCGWASDSRMDMGVHLNFLWGHACTCLCGVSQSVCYVNHGSWCQLCESQTALLGQFLERWRQRLGFMGFWLLGDTKPAPPLPSCILEQFVCIFHIHGSTSKG